MKNSQVIAIINKIIGEEVEYEIRSDTLIFLNIFEELLEINSDIETGIYFAETPYILKNIDEIFNYVLIRTFLVNGWSQEHRKNFCIPDLLRQDDLEHLGRLAFNRSVTTSDIFDEIINGSCSPAEALYSINKKFPVTKKPDLLNTVESLNEVSPKLVKSVRSFNRKWIIAIIKKQVQEVENNI